MKIFKKLIVAVLFLGMSFSVSADGFYIGTGLGGGDLEIEANFLPELGASLEDNDGAMFVGFFAGYEFSNGLFVDLEASSYGTFNFLGVFDQVNAFSNRVGIGYVLPSESRFQFYGKTGINFWRVELTEGIFLNPGPEESFERSGEDSFFEIGTDYHLRDSMRLGLNYSFSDTEFGETSGAKITFKWFPWADKSN